MKMGRRRDGQGIDAFGEQFIELFECGAAGELGSARAVLGQRIDNSNQRDVRQSGQYAGMIAAHDACARSRRYEGNVSRRLLRPACPPWNPCHLLRFLVCDRPARSLALGLRWRIVGKVLQTHFDSNNYTAKLR